MRTTRQQDITSIRKEIKKYQKKIKQQRATINTFLDYSLASERLEDGIVSQLTDTSMHFMEIHEQTLDGIAKLNNFASRMKYTNRRLMGTITQLFDNTAFAIYNHEQVLNSMSQHISSGGNDVAHSGKKLAHSGKASAHSGTELAHTNISSNDEKNYRGLLKLINLI